MRIRWGLRPKLPQVRTVLAGRDYMCASDLPSRIYMRIDTAEWSRICADDFRRRTPAHAIAHATASLAFTCMAVHAVVCLYWGDCSALRRSRTDSAGCVRHLCLDAGLTSSSFETEVWSVVTCCRWMCETPCVCVCVTAQPSRTDPVEAATLAHEGACTA